MAFAVLVDLIDKGADLIFEEERRKQNIFPLPVGLRQTVDLGGVKFKVLQMTPQLHCLVTKKLNPFRFFLTRSMYPNVCVSAPAFDLHQEYTKAGHTILHLAIIARAANFVHVILEFGVCFWPALLDGALSDECGHRPLHLAIINNSLEIATDLLNFGADPFKRNKRGETGLFLGMCGHDAMQNLVVERSASLNPSVTSLLVSAQPGCMKDAFGPMAKALDDPPPGHRRCHKGNHNCTIPTCVNSRGVRICHRCRVLFCAFHVERHQCIACRDDARYLQDLEGA